MVPREQDGASERAALARSHLLWAREQVAEREDRMLGLLEALGYLELASTIPGLSPVGVAQILAETGEPARYDSGRAWAKHAGICPRDNGSGRQRGRAAASGRGRPRLPTAAWRGVWPLLQRNPAFRARHRRLRERRGNPLTDQQARVAVAAALLRRLWVVLTHRVAWDPALASPEEVVRAA